MSLEKIRETIINEARAESEKIEARAREKAEEVFKAQEKKLREQFSQQTLQMKNAIDSRIQGEISRVRTEGIHRILRLKNRLIADIFEQATEEISGKSPDRYKKWLAGQLKKAAGQGEGTLKCNQRDRKLIEEIIKEQKSKFRIADEEVPISGGFIVEGEKWDYDFSIDTLMADLRESILPEIAEELFGEM